jgi:1-acyl-sn-glycerol-3-phosphate acyltransferase
LIDRARRILSTGTSFVIFGIGGLLLSVLVFPLIALFSASVKDRERRCRWIISKVFKVFLWIMMTLRALDLEIEDAAQLAEAKGTLVLANHPSLIDVIMILAQMPQGNCVVKSVHWTNPFLWGVVRAAGYVRNDAGEAMLEDSARAITAGECLVVFPEATRTVPGEPMRFYRGAANIALRTRAPIQLIHLECRPPCLTKAVPWYRVPETRPCFRLRVGDILDVSQYIDDAAEASIASRQLTRVLHDRLSEDVFRDVRA